METTSPAGGAGPQAAPAGGIAASSPAPSRFTVEYLGLTKGHVSFLGFMKDPSVVWIYIGSILIILGTLVAFMITYREVWAFHDPETGRLYLATKVRGTSPAAHREFDRLVAELAASSLRLNG
jgi:cytochrome c biogenesis protein ResB